ncbi:MAG TPA: c-type cytochrome [Gammaproteobacteria bacterium]
MSESQSETFSTHNIAVFGGLLLIAVFIGEVLIGPQGDQQPVAVSADTTEDIAMRLKPVVTLDEVRDNMTVAAGAGTDADKPPAELYQSACLACHSTGAAGAPRIGDATAWAARLVKGVDALVSSAVNGIGAMPPRGGSQISDEQIRAVVEYILDESR